MNIIHIISYELKYLSQLGLNVKQGYFMVKVKFDNNENVDNLAKKPIGIDRKYFILWAPAAFVHANRFNHHFHIQISMYYEYILQPS